MMVALTIFLPWVPHIWMSGTNPLQTPRAWFGGTHKWAISAALLADGVSFGSHTLSIPMADVEVVAGRSTLPFTSYVFRVRDASRWGWAPLRLGARHRLYLAIHRDDTITISWMQRNHVYRCAQMHDFHPAQKASIFRFRGTESVWEKEKWQKEGLYKREI